MFTLDHAPDTFCPDGVGGETRLESQDYETVQNSYCNDVFFSFIISLDFCLAFTYTPNTTDIQARTQTHSLCQSSLVIAFLILQF